MTEVQQTKRPRVKSGRLIRLYVSDIHAENIMRFYVSTVSSQALSSSRKAGTGELLLRIVVAGAVQAESDISMKGMMDAYADKFSLDLDKTRFLYCGMRIHHGQTPHEYDMEDGDEIEVFQVGAFCHPDVHARLNTSMDQHFLGGREVEELKGCT